MPNDSMIANASHSLLFDSFAANALALLKNTMNISWSESIEDVDWQELADLYERAPLAKKSPEKLRQAFGNSMFHRIIRDDKEIVGAGRTVADGCECAYVCDVTLLPEYQGKGLGKAIVQRLIEQAHNHRRIITGASSCTACRARKASIRRSASGV